MLVRIAAALALVLLVAGCSTGEDRPDERDHDGPLSVQSGVGEYVAAAPRGAGDRWTMTFGAFRLCSTEPEQEITIDEVRFDLDPEPVAIDVWYRIVPPVDQRTTGDRSDWNPYAGVRGAPPFNGRVTGQFVESLAGPVTDECRDAGSRDGFTELMTTMTSDVEGAMARRTYIDYSADGERHTLTVRWRNGMCGTQVPLRGCRPSPAR